MKAFDRNQLKEAVRGSVKRVYVAQTVELDLYRNTLDCFSASIDAVVQGISLDDWMLQEKERQVQKTKQNAIGSLHEDIIGSIPAVTKLAVGNVIDVVSIGKKLIAEIKNKHNTTKGNHKVAIYDDLAKELDKRPGYVGYYVEILPKGQKAYNVPFTPSDNKTQQNRVLREDIRQIDGRSFYAILTGYTNALDELYKVLPSIVEEIVKEEFEVVLDSEKVTKSDAFISNFEKAYGK
ncbi:Eco47II family restriction endonuclease [Enterovibrio sp. FF113]|uniref:Eco47II family restriction endonuclease n=1 Tax=Enterovibrio sp. FF113 TaxID=3230010 RepID=UPI00352EC4A1